MLQYVSDCPAKLLPRPAARWLPPHAAPCCPLPPACRAGLPLAYRLPAALAAAAGAAPLVAFLAGHVQGAAACRAGLPLAAAAPPLLPPVTARARGGPSRERGAGTPVDGEESGLKGPQNLLSPSPERVPAPRTQTSTRLCCRAAAAATSHAALRPRCPLLPPPARYAAGAAASPPRLRAREACRAASAEWVLLWTVQNQGSKGLKTCWTPHLKECLLRACPSARPCDARHAAAPPPPRRRCRATAATPPLPRRRATADAPRAPSSQRRCIGVTAHTITRAPPPNTITSQRHRPHTHAEPARRSPSASI